MPSSQMEGYFKNPYFKRTLLFLLALKWNLYKKAFSTSTEMLKEATINLFLIDKSRFSNICTL